MSSALPPISQANYLAWLRAEPGLTTVVLPDASPYIQLTYNLAVSIVNPDLATIDGDIYTLAIYNFATDRLINLALDQTGQSFFKDARTSYGLNSFVSGVVVASGDESTNQTLGTPESLKQLTLMDLGQLKTPYGRTYLEFAQMTGTLWGLT